MTEREQERADVTPPHELREEVARAIELGTIAHQQIGANLLAALAWVERKRLRAISAPSPDLAMPPPS